MIRKAKRDNIERTGTKRNCYCGWTIGTLSSVADVELENADLVYFDSVDSPSNYFNR